MHYYAIPVRQQIRLWIKTEGWKIHFLKIYMIHRTRTKRWIMSQDE